MSREMEGAQKVPESDVVPEPTESEVENEALPGAGGTEEVAPAEPAPEAYKNCGGGLCMSYALTQNHLVGPQVEFAYPSSLLDNEELSAQLPFLALPDGSHLSEEDFCYFHMLCKSLYPSTIFGISCNRQINADALINKGSQVTRSMVQKAIVVLATKPIFGPLREKLGMVTRAFFAQRDLNNLSLLEDFHGTLEMSLRMGTVGESSHALDGGSALYMGTSLREFIYHWRFKALSLVKLLLLQRKILFFGYPVERLCMLQYNLVALIPALLSSLEDSASPELHSQSDGRVKAESLKMSDRHSLLSFMGLPLALFSEDAFFQPCCPLQQIDTLKCGSWLVGTTNSIFKQQRSYKPDVVVDLQINDPALSNAVTLTPSDRSWMDQVINVVLETWNEGDPTQPTLMQYEGSDDYLRARFEEYIFGFLSTAKYANQLPPAPPDTPVDPQSPTAQFGAEAIDLFRATRVFKEWDALTDDTLCDLIGCKHPCSGKVTALSDAALRLSAGLHDLRIDESLAPTREAIGAAFQAGSAGLSKVASSWRTDLAKLNTGWNSPRAGRSANTSVDLTHNPPDLEGVSTPTSEAPPGSASTSPAPTWDSRKQEALSTLQATGAQGYAALGNLGSFLSAKQKAWSSRRPRNEDTQ